jgi:hypothetical protein
MNAPRAAVLLVAAALLLPRSARTQAAVETKFFDEQARNHYERREYKDALRDFLRSDAVTPSARSLYNIAVTADLAGERGLAFAYLDQYLGGTDDDAQRRGDATERLARIEKKLAIVRVVSDPPGASIFVDGVEYGEYGRTPRRIALDPGQRRIELALEGFVGATTKVEAVVGRTVEASAALAARTGTLLADSDPPGAAIVVTRDGRPVAVTFVDGAAKLPVGEYHLAGTAPDRKPAGADAVVRDGETSRVTLVMAAVPQPVGRLLVGATGVAARVLVDGRAKAVTPATLESLPVGSHTVELQADGFATWRGGVVIRDGKATYLDVSMTRSAR